MHSAVVSEDEKRRHPRRKMMKSAKVIFNDNQSLYDCAVRDLSVSGAKLVFPTLVPLPRHFTLKMHDGTEHACDVVRVAGVTVGVAFVDK